MLGQGCGFVCTLPVADPIVDQDVTPALRENKAGGPRFRTRIGIVARGILAWLRYHNDVGNLEIIQR